MDDISFTLLAPHTTRVLDAGLEAYAQYHMLTGNVQTLLDRPKVEDIVSAGRYAHIVIIRRRTSKQENLPFGVVSPPGRVDDIEKRLARVGATTCSWARTVRSIIQSLPSSASSTPRLTTKNEH